MFALSTASSMDNALIGLEIMAFGMIGIFAVLFLIFVAVKVLIKVFPEK